MASGILAGMQGKLGHAAWRQVFFLFERNTELTCALDGCFILVRVLYDVACNVALIYISEGALTIFVAVCAYVSDFSAVLGKLNSIPNSEYSSFPTSLQPPNG